MESAKRCNASARQTQDHSSPPAEVECAVICAQAGVKFVGIQNGVPECNFPALVLFLDSFGSTLALPVPEFSIGAIIVKAAKSNEKWQVGVGLVRVQS